MAYSGSGTKADPYIVDNWADFLTVENLRYDTYIKWADKETPNDKVVPPVTINSRTDWKAAEVDFNGWTFEQIYIDAAYPTVRLIYMLAFADTKIYNWHIINLIFKDCQVTFIDNSTDMYNCYFDNVICEPKSSTSEYWKYQGLGNEIFRYCNFHYSVVNTYTEECNMVIPSGQYYNSEIYVHYKYTGTTAIKSRNSLFINEIGLHNSYMGGVVDVSEGTGSFAITDPHRDVTHGNQYPSGMRFENSIINIEYKVSENCTISAYNSNTTFYELPGNIKTYYVTNNGNNQAGLTSIPSSIRCTKDDIRNPDTLSTDNFSYITDDEVRYSQYGGKSPNLVYGGIDTKMYNPGTGEYMPNVQGWISSVNLIEVSPDTEYTFSTRYMPKEIIGLFTYEYDANMNFIVAQSTTTSATLTCRTWTTRSTTKYVRCSITGLEGMGVSDFGDFNLNLGGEQLPYSPYGDRTDEDWRWRQTVYINDGVPFLPFWFYPIYEPPVIYPIERAERISVYDILEPQNGFDHNGLAILFPSEVISYKEDMGRWDLELTHPIDPYGKWSYIVGQNTVKVNGQIFRIDETELYADADQQYIRAHANHITYDLNDKFVGDASFTVSTGLAYEAQLMLATREMVPSWEPTPYEYQFELTSDITGTLVADVQDQTITGALYGDDNSFANRYGGHLYRDNFHLSINTVQENLPAAPAFQLRFGTDLTKLSYKIDFSSWITELVCENNFGELWACTYEGSEWMIHHHKTKRIHFTYPPGTPDTLQTLIKDGEAYWETVATPKISIEVAVANLKNDPKYKEFIDLQNFDVGYTGTVYFEQFNIDVDLKIVSIRRNELTGEAIQIILGNAPNSFIRSPVMSQTIVPNSSVEAKQAQTVQAMQDEIENVKLKSMRLWSGIRSYTWNDVKQYNWEEIKNGKRNS